MLISTEMKLYYDIVSGKYDKNTVSAVFIRLSKAMKFLFIFISTLTLLVGKNRAAS